MIEVEITITIKSEPDEKPSPSEIQPEQQSKFDRAFFALFLPALWKLTGYDPYEMERQLEKAPFLSQYFDMDSPEVRAVIRQ